MVTIVNKKELCVASKSAFKEDQKNLASLKLNKAKRKSYYNVYIAPMAFLKLATCIWLLLLITKHCVAAKSAFKDAQRNLKSFKLNKAGQNL